MCLLRVFGKYRQKRDRLSWLRQISDSLRVSRDAARIANEVIQHLTKLVGADVEVTLDIQARLQDGASDKTVRDVTENCRTLRFNSFGFEEE